VKCKINNPSCSSGFSLVELMLAMLIGLIIMGGVMQVYVSTQDTQRSSEDQLTLLANGRFAIETIAYDLRHTGLWGRNNTYQSISCQKSGTENVDPCPAGYEMPVATDDCGVEEYINLERPLFAMDNNNPYSATCATQSYKAGTDVLSVRYADTNKLGDGVLGTGMAYIRSSVRSGMLFMGPNIPAKSIAARYDWDNEQSLANSNHLLISRSYYVSDYTDAAGDGLPSLRRVDLVQGPLLKSDILLPGVEDFQLEFGVDLGTDGASGTDKDGQANSYVDASNVTSWSNGEVVAVRIWLLMRSEREDRDNISSAQTFTIAGNVVTTPNDGDRRYVMSSIVKLRNTYQSDLEKAGGN